MRFHEISQIERKNEQIENAMRDLQLRNEKFSSQLTSAKQQIKKLKVQALFDDRKSLLSVKNKNTASITDYSIDEFNIHKDDIIELMSDC